MEREPSYGSIPAAAVTAQVRQDTGQPSSRCLFTLRAAAAHLSAICRPAGGSAVSALLQGESVAPWQISDSFVLFVGGVLCGRCFFLAVSGLYGEENARCCRRGGSVRAAMLRRPGNHWQRQPGHISCR